MIKEQFQVNSVITSPPYFGLRDNKIEPSIWDGDPECEHYFDNERIIKINKSHIANEGGKIFHGGKITPEDLVGKETSQGQFCSKCGAWKGSLGLEPDFNLYIKHLCDIYDLVWKVLKKTGTCWVNLGDTYNSSGTKNTSHKESVNNLQNKKLLKTIHAKCLLMLPQRFAIEMINRGWILRNVIIWHKPNAMPSSAKDRFTVDFEYVFFFVKSNKTQYWINEKTAQLVSKQPLGTKGIENIDWEWRECNKCFGTGIKHKKCKECKEEGWIYNTYLQPIQCPECEGKGRIKQNEECKSCKGKGIKKYNFWRGRQYWFEQQLEQSSTEFIYSRNSNKGGVQAKNNPHAHWGYTREELAQITKKEPGWYKSGRGNWNNGFGESSNFKKGSEIKKNLLGRNKRTVWTIPTQPNLTLHFSTFPPTLIEPMILSGCPKFVCEKCGKPREKIMDNSIRVNTRPGKNVGNAKSGTGSDPNKSLYRAELSTKRQKIISKIIGYSDCNHGNKWKPGIVLDPFAGTGTTLYQAWDLGRNYIGFEISKEYYEIAEKYLSKTRFKRLDDFIYPEHRKIEV